MTESVQPGRVILLPNGVTTVFALPFRVLQDQAGNSNVVVKPYTIATGVLGAALVEGTDYTVTGVGADTGSITTEGASSPWTSAVSLIAYTDSPVIQELDYVDNDPMPAADGTEALDLLCEIARNHKDRLDRSMKFSVAYPMSGVPGVEIPTPPLNGATIYWDTTLGWTWTTVSLALLQTQAALLASIASDITTVAGIEASVVSVAGNASNINTVAGDIAYVAAVGAAIAAVIAVAGDLTAINAVYADLTDINLVAGSIANINSVEAALTAINAVYADLTNIDAVAADLTDIAGVYGALTAINAVYADLTAVNAVYPDLTQIVGVYNDLTDINGVYADLTNINAVYAALTNINTVAGISANVTTVAGMSANIATVVANLTTITNAANNIPKAKLAASVAPTTGNDNTQGYSAGSLWCDTTHDLVYICTNPATGAAVWNSAFAASSLATLSDVSVTSLANNNFLIYNSGASKWENVAIASVPALNQNTSGTAANLSGTPTLPNGTTASTQSQADGSAKLATTSYVDTAFNAAVQGLSPKGSCFCAANTNQVGTYLTGVFTYTSAAVTVIDGQTITTIGQRVGLFAQSTGNNNGLYSVTQVGTVSVPTILTRTTDYNTTADVQPGTYTIVEYGTANTGIWINTTATAIVLDTTAMTFTQVPFAPAASALTGTTLASGVTVSSLVTLGALTDITTNNVSTSAHGFAPKAPNDSTKFLNGTGVYSVPASAVGYNAQASTYAPVAGDLGKLVDFTGSSSATWTLTSAATLGANWSTTISNSGTAGALLTLKSSSGTIDGIAAGAGFIVYPGEVREVWSDGTNFHSKVLHGFQYKVTSSGSWMVPPGYKEFRNRIWAGGQSGAARATTGNAGGGAGGAYIDITLESSKFVAAGSTETLTVAGTAAGVSGNTNGTVANSSSVTINGTTFTIGVSTSTYGVAPTNAAVGTLCNAGWPQIPYGNIYGGVAGESGGVGGDVSVGNVPEFQYGANTPNQVHAGGGGGACASTAGGVRTGGVSIYGGLGGAGGLNTGGNGTNGTVPGGGGGAACNGGTSGSGAGGTIVVSGII
jgi:hypothetical protein